VRYTKKKKRGKRKMNWIQIVLALVQLTPDIIKLILQAEQIFGAGQGPAKKAFVMSPVTAAAPPEFSTKVSDMVEAQIAALNAAGKLPHASGT